MERLLPLTSAEIPPKTSPYFLLSQWLNHLSSQPTEASLCSILDLFSQSFQALIGYQFFSVYLSDQSTLYAGSYQRAYSSLPETYPEQEVFFYRHYPEFFNTINKSAFGLCYRDTKFNSVDLPNHYQLLSTDYRSHIFIPLIHQSKQVALVQLSHCQNYYLSKHLSLGRVIAYYLLPYVS